MLTHLRKKQTRFQITVDLKKLNWKRKKEDDEEIMKILPSPILFFLHFVRSKRKDSISLTYPKWEIKTDFPFYFLFFYCKSYLWNARNDYKNAIIIMLFQFGRTNMVVRDDRLNILSGAGLYMSLQN